MGKRSRTEVECRKNGGQEEIVRERGGSVKKWKIVKTEKLKIKTLQYAAKVLSPQASTTHSLDE